MEERIIRAIEFHDVSEGYNIDLIIDGKASREKFMALEGINLSIDKGESVAVIGANGAGKSTLLRLIAGLIRPDKGEVKVFGRVGSLLDLGAGFHPELTGRDNLLLNASLYNFNSADMNYRFKEILDFAGIGKFIDTPVRCYSQGMYVRLAFSLAIHVDPDILLIDDCLAVGDEDFQMKCIDKALELKERNVTIVFVTHDMRLAGEVCNRGIYIKGGRINKDAVVREAISSYTGPLEAERAGFRHLGARQRQEEAERKRQEEAERKRQEEESRKKKEKYLKCARIGLKISSGRVRLYYDDVEITGDMGLYTIFNIDGAEYNSSGASWRLSAVKENECFCYLRWGKGSCVFQAWRIVITQEGAVSLEIAMRVRNGKTVQNERTELSLSSRYNLAPEAVHSNKLAVLTVNGNPEVSFISLKDRQVSWGRQGASGPLLYFLTVPDRESYVEKKRSRYVYFKGTVLLGRKVSAAAEEKFAVSSVEDSFLKVIFSEGKVDCFWKEARLTGCLGVYTSLCDKKAWYDSSQAVWRILKSSPDEISAEGFFPWVPVSQRWKVSLKEPGVILFDIEMEIYREVALDMQEFAGMFIDRYGEWISKEKRDIFPAKFTSNDLFRYCLWSGNADGVNFAGLCSTGLPEILFKPDSLEGYNILIENAGHIYNTKSRLLHCIKENKRRYLPGVYKLFSGKILFKEEGLCGRQRS